MKILLVLGVLLVPAGVLAQEDATKQAASSISKEDAARLREDMRALAQAMGVAPADEKKDKEEDKTADVANRALDMVQGMVAQVSQSLEQVAPKVWGIMIRQQYAKAAFGIVTPGAILITALVLFFYGRRLRIHYTEKERNSDSEAVAIGIQAVTFLTATAMCVWIGVSLGYGAKYVINPEYYAVRDILVLITNPTALN